MTKDHQSSSCLQQLDSILSLSHLHVSLTSEVSQSMPCVNVLLPAHALQWTDFNQFHNVEVLANFIWTTLIKERLRNKQCSFLAYILQQDNTDILEVETTSKRSQFC